MASLLTGIVALGGTAGAAWAQGEVIGQRQAGLKRMGTQMQAIKAVLDGSGDTRTLVPGIQDMQNFFQGFPALFPPGSGTGETKALPSVWSERAGFESAATGMVAAVQKLNAAAASGDNAATAAAFRETGAACGTCHRGYRAR
jgi:cytochrome c556